MGLFDMFKGKAAETKLPIENALKAFVYLITSDGVVSNEEIGMVLAIIGGKSYKNSITVGGQDKEMVERVFKHVKENPGPEKFIASVKDVLSQSQKLYIVTNMMDLSLGDGEASESEQAMIAKFIEGWDIDMGQLAPIYSVLELKNDKRIFLEESYFKNEDSYSFDFKIKL